MNRFYFVFLWLFPLTAATQTITPFIRLDQFGYLPQSEKVAVIADPQVGFNAADAFSPGTAYEVRDAASGQVVWTGAPTVWQNGTTHTQSGDKGWWVNFSSLTTPGTYFLVDVQKNVRSYAFEIGDQAYRNLLRHAVRMFFYQRIGFDKQSAYTGEYWADGASYLGPGQDTEARSRWAKNDPSTARDVRGGWMDAGDENKYTTFAEGVILQLMQAYRSNPSAFTDDYNIPESGNGIPDLLDEVKWELDYFVRTQDATGTNGFLLKVGVDNYNSVSPPSTDTRPRFYLPECTSATLSGAAMFASAGLVYQALPQPDMQAFGADLLDRAQKAWARATVTTNNFTTFETACDDGDIKSGDADRNADGQLEAAVLAAIYLYEATGDALYRDFVEAKHTLIEPVKTNWWGPYKSNLETALLRFSGLSGVNSSVASQIRNQKAGMNYLFSLQNHDAQTDLYRAHMDDWAHHWGSNFVRANCGSINLDFIDHQINPTQAAQYRTVAEQYLHWLHGTNPLGMVMLSNMYDAGAEFCANEIYHTWFGNGTDWDNALTSPKGPAPGYVVGGPNKDFSYPQLSPPAGQPAQKSYKDFNDGWPYNSWEITEPAIYYQSAYILLLSRVLPAVATAAPVQPTHAWALQVSPNPASTVVWVQGTAPAPCGLTFTLTDAQGKVLRNTHQQVGTGQFQVALDVADLAAGVYALHCTDGTAQATLRVVVK